MFEVLEECPCDKLDIRESYWISFYTERQQCYNIQPGGRVILVQYVTPEGHKRAGEKNRERMLGTSLSKETRDKMSESRKGKRVHRNNDRLTDKQAATAKSMFIEGKTSKEIMDALNIPYKPINAILSNNAYSTVHVDGWDAFWDRNRNEVERHKALVAQIKPLWLDGNDIATIAETLDLPPHTVKYYVKKI